MNLDEESAAIFLLYQNIPVEELEIARRTGGVFKAPVGMQLVGRVLNALGAPLDALGDLNIVEYRP